MNTNQHAIKCYVPVGMSVGYTQMHNKVFIGQAYNYDIEASSALCLRLIVTGK